MKKIYFTFPIFFLACTLYATAQINITDDLKQQLAAINTGTIKSNRAEVTSTKADYFNQRISLFTNNSFKVGLIPNPTESIDNGGSAQPSDQKSVTKASTESRKLARDAKYFRQHISLFNGNAFQFNLVANKVAKTAKPAATEVPTASSNGTSTIDVAPVTAEIAKAVIIEDRKTARDAKYFRQHISLINGTAFQLSLEPNKTIRLKRVKTPASLAGKYAYITGIFAKPVVIEDPKPPIVPVTDEELQASLIKNIDVNMAELHNQFAAVVADSLRASIPQKMPSNVTNIKTQVALILNDTLKANLYHTLAKRYLIYDSISILQTKQFFQESALDFTMKALHTYSKLGDQDGLRTSYSGLAKIYKDQKKFSEAKWFVLQANAIARQQKDTKNVITSLIDLAAVKTAIKDYKLALTDLNEAQQLATQNHLAKQESSVQANYAVVYAELNDAAKSAAALKRHNAIESSIRKAEAARRSAKIKSQDSTANLLINNNDQAQSVVTAITPPKGKKKSTAAVTKTAQDSTTTVKLQPAKKPVIASNKKVQDTTATASQPKRKLLTAVDKKALKTPPAKKVAEL